MTVRDRRLLYEQAVALIAREYAAELSVEDVARRLFTSRRQLQRVFSDAGTSFRTVCCQARMAAARRLFRLRPHMTVREVAFAVGYRQAAQFAKAFRREVGVSPSEFKADPSFAGRMRRPPASPERRATSESTSLETLLRVSA
jgi:AraC-like DNA-binding protein